MHKRIAKSAHYLPRKGSYSTVPYRNGRVEILPPNAQIALYDIAVQISDGEDRLLELRENKKSLEKEIFTLSRVDQLRDKHGSLGSEDKRISKIKKAIDEIETKMRRLRRQLGELNSIISDGPKISFENVFMRLAQIELPTDTFDLLAFKTKRIMDRARQKKS